MNTLSSKSIQTEKAEESLILTEREERKTRYFPPQPPLIWLDSRFDYVSDDKENIKAMMRGSKDFIGCDLITTPRCVAGIEADLVIFLGSGYALTGCMSRCRGQFVQIK